MPPATFSDWRYLAVAIAGGHIAFGLRRWLERVTLPISVLDAAGLSLFAVTGASTVVADGGTLAAGWYRTTKRWTNQPLLVRHLDASDINESRPGPGRDPVQ